MWRRSFVCRPAILRVAGVQPCKDYRSQSHWRSARALLRRTMDCFISARASPATMSILRRCRGWMTCSPTSTAPHGRSLPVSVRSALGEHQRLVAVGLSESQVSTGARVRGAERAGNMRQSAPAEYGCGMIVPDANPAADSEALQPGTRPLQVSRRSPQIIAACALCVIAGPATAGDESAQQSTPAGTKCEVAVVNPVSGYAECVQPRGVPVEQPPPRSPPTPDECLKHADLDLEPCRQTHSPPEHAG